jgi:type IV pilus assembly protein PilA
MNLEPSIDASCAVIASALTDVRVRQVFSLAPSSLPIPSEDVGIGTDCVFCDHPIQPDGFTLMELLIVIAVILILMLMAVPTIGSMKKHANEISAITSVQTIVAAEMMYATSYPAKGYACSLTALGGDPAAGLPTPEAAELLQADLAGGYKAGYIFNITNCVKSAVSGSDYVRGYTITAVPQAVGKTGDRGFCIDQNGGSPKYDPAGGTNCTSLLQ